MEAFYTARWAIVKQAYQSATVERVAEVVRRARDGRRGGAALLLGAGVSVSAGIPSAAGVIADIRKQFPTAFDGCTNKKSYPAVMACLSTEERRELIKGYVGKANINWAYIAIAEMIKAGYVEYVLTTNFDPLLSRACALIGQFPAIYDLAVSSEYPTAAIDGPGIFHLHGQHSGFALMNTDNEVKKNAKRMREVFKKVDTSRPWIVCGYSGECDPVVDQLVHLKKFHGNLFWAGYGDSEPNSELQNKLFRDSQHRWIKGHDADGFFVNLAQKLSVFPPKFISKPFSYLEEMLNGVPDYKPPSLVEGVPSQELMQKPRGLIRRAVSLIENISIESANIKPKEINKNPEIQIESFVIAAEIMNKNYEFVFQKLGKNVELLDYETKKLIHEAALAFCKHAARQREAHPYQVSIDVCKYADFAIQALPDSPCGYIEKANALRLRSSLETQPTSSMLHSSAVSLYEKAISINPTSSEAYVNWGIAIKLTAFRKHMNTNVLLADAEEKINIAYKIRKNSAIFELGCLAALRNQKEDAKNG